MMRSSSLSSSLNVLISSSNSLAQTKQLHGRCLLLRLLPDSAAVTAALILSYSSFNLPHLSSLLFNSSPLHLRSADAFLHNSLIRALTAAGLPLAALHAFNSLLLLSPRPCPDHRTFPFALKACADSKSHRKGLELHASIHKLGFDSDVFVGNTLLAFYASCAGLDNARQLFDEMPLRDVVSWNSLLSAGSDNGSFGASMDWFKKLVGSGCEVNAVSLVSVLPACGETRNEGFGMGVHAPSSGCGLGELQSRSIQRWRMSFEISSGRCSN